MITDVYIKNMARYNRWQNESLYAAADSLSEEERRKDNGVFWTSIHGTLSHLYWGDQIWMSRFGLTVKPEVGQKASAEFISEWNELKNNRCALDKILIQWADEYPKGEITGTLKWYSG